MIKNLLVSISVAAILVGGYAWAGSPVTINNPANTQTAIVDSAGLHVVCDTGCLAGSGSPSAVNLVGINGVAPSLTNPIFTAYAEAGDTTGTFTNATQATAVTATNADGYATALVSINGTYGTATALFQASDDGGVTFYNMSCVRSDGTAVETGYTTLTNTNRQWFCPVSGNDSFRVQSSAVASGTVNVRVSISAPPTNSAVVSGPTGTGANQVQGTAATGGAPVGNPLQDGCQGTSIPTVSAGNMSPLQCATDGSLRAQIIGAANTTMAALTTGANLVYQLGATSNPHPMGTVNYLFNGASEDAQVSIVGAAGAGTGTTATHVAPTTSINASTTAGQCTVACASLIVSGAHNIYGAGFSSTATGWLLLEDATSCAANGTITPLRAYAYPTASVTQTLSWGDVPRSVATGMALCFSTTGPYTATASTTAFIWADYK